MCGGCKGKKCVGGQTVLIAIVSGKPRLVRVSKLWRLWNRYHEMQLLFADGLSLPKCLSEVEKIEKTGKAETVGFPDWPLYTTPDHRIYDGIALGLSAEKWPGVIPAGRDDVFEFTTDTGGFILAGPHGIWTRSAREELPCSTITETAVKP